MGASTGAVEHALPEMPTLAASACPTPVVGKPTRSRGLPLSHQPAFPDSASPSRGVSDPRALTQTCHYITKPREPKYRDGLYNVTMAWRSMVVLLFQRSFC